MADLTPILRAANRFLMPHLMEACKLRLAGVIVEEDPSVFELYDAATAIRDVDVQQMVRALSRDCCIRMEFRPAQCDDAWRLLRQSVQVQKNANQGSLPPFDLRRWILVAPPHWSCST